MEGIGEQQSKRKFAHRSYQLVFKFVKDTGNGSDLDKLC